MKRAPTRLQLPSGTFELQRYPARRRETLQAWCAADLLLLEAVDALPSSPKTLLVVNDEFGALSLALTPLAAWTDSSLAMTALRRNEQANDVSTTPIVWSTELPPAADVVVMRVPKHLPYFHQQLAVLSATLQPGSRVMAGGMDKHLSSHTASAMEQWIGPTTRHPGQRKARIFSAVLESTQKSAPPAACHYHVDELDAELSSMVNVFSANSLDIGSRFLLSQLGRLSPGQRLVDLACGNGVLGLAAYRTGLAQQVTFCDESAMAIASARDNAGRLFPAANGAFDFFHGDGLNGLDPLSADLVLCNPPFHQGHVVDEYAGRRLLAQCPRHLAPGGGLCLVANRHLAYRPTLSKQFKEVSVLAENSKFTVYLARSPR